jgi:pyridoxamine 5'-phosphate oxidase
LTGERPGDTVPAMTLAELRKEYSLAGLSEKDLARDPFRQFEKWFQEVEAAKVPEPNAAVLATAARDGRPSGRMVLLKAVDGRGFVFYTSYDSRKGRELEANPRASYVFPWIALERQVIIEGAVVKVAREESEAYFHSRPRASQLAAWASPQSSIIAGREALEEAMKAWRGSIRAPRRRCPRTGADSGSSPRPSSSGRGAGAGSTTGSATAARRTAPGWSSGWLPDGNAGPRPMIYLMRHADAVSDEVDPARPLSAKGREQVAQGVRDRSGNPRASAPGDLAQPAVRSRETAELLAQGLGLSAPLVLTPGLEPDDDPGVIAAVLDREGRDIAVVGHEPHLGALASLMSTARRRGVLFPFPKAGVLALSREGRRWRAGVARALPMILDVLPERTGARRRTWPRISCCCSAIPGGRRATGTTDGGRPRSRSATARRSPLSAASSRRRGTFDLCRRPTGGGIVDHRDDWTYASSFPGGTRSRSCARRRATARSTRRSPGRYGGPACRLRSSRPPSRRTAGEPGGPAGVCFERAEIFDVVHARVGAKIAGGAQKRNKRGLLFQGSIWKPAAGGDAVDWDALGEEFVEGMAARLGAEASAAPWPEFAEGEEEGLAERYASPEWMELR